MRILFAFLLVSLFSSCYMVRAYKNRNLTLESHARLPSVPIGKGDAPFHFVNADDPSGYADLKSRLDEQLAGTHTAAMLIIRNDTILYENYFDGFSKESLLPSFSVVKSFVGTLVGICLDEGKLKSTDEPFTNYLPKFLKKDKRFADITIQHLLDMRSGLNWNEGEYGLKDDAIKLAFRPNMTRFIYKVKVKEAPGNFEYQSINTLLLAMIVEEATGKSINEYLQEKIWVPLGMENAATWSSDKRHREIAYAGLNATARDFAKFGRLWLNKGNWQGKQVVSEAWVNNTSSVAAMSASGGYKNQFWSSTGYRDFADSLQAAAAGRETPGSSGGVRSYKLDENVKRYYITYTQPAFYALGILGQHVYINPANNCIIVRLGHNWSHARFSLQQFIASLGNQL